MVTYGARRTFRDPETLRGGNYNNGWMPNEEVGRRLDAEAGSQALLIAIVRYFARGGRG